jgi:hypothetical protein
MSGSPVAAGIRAWVNLYTRGLPAEIKTARRDEIDDDLWCQLEEAAAEGRSGHEVDTELLVRLVLGMPADVGWSLAQRGRPAPVSVEGSTSMTDRTLGGWAIAAGLIYSALGALYIPVGDALWAGGLGVYVILASLLGGFAFAVTGVGLAWRYQEHLGRVGALGGGLVALGALVTQGGPPQILALGSGILMFELGRIGVISWRQSAVHVATALAVLVAFGIVHPESVDASGRALAIAAFGPYILSWIAIGVSLTRRSAQSEAASAA